MGVTGRGRRGSSAGSGFPRSISKNKKDHRPRRPSRSPAKTLDGSLRLESRVLGTLLGRKGSSSTTLRLHRHQGGLWLLLLPGLRLQVRLALHLTWLNMDLFCMVKLDLGIINLLRHSPPHPPSSRDRDHDPPRFRLRDLPLPYPQLPLRQEDRGRHI